MSYLFDGVDDYILTENAAATAVPLTMACWANVSNDTTNNNLVCLMDKDADTDYFILSANGAVAGDPIRAGTSSSAGTDFAASTTGYTTNTWFHACAVFASTTDRRAFINGGSKGTSTPSIAPLNLDRTSVGRLMRATPGGPVAGKVAEVAIWTVALSDSEVAQLASGTRPSMIQTNKLVYYQPLGSNANDLGPYRFSPIVISGAVPDTPHPTITDPSVGELYEEILADDPLRFYRLTEHGRYATDSGSQKIHFPATGEPLGKQTGAIVSRPDEYSMTYDGVNDAHFGSAPNIASDPGAEIVDTFTDTNGDDLATQHTGENNAIWTQHTTYNQPAQISGNMIRPTNEDQTAVLYASGTLASANYYVEGLVNVRSLVGQFYSGVAGRLDTSAETWYEAMYQTDNNRWELRKRVAGTITILGTFAQTLTVSQTYTVKLDMRGTTIRLLVGGVERVSVTDSSISAAGKAGVSFYWGNTPSDSNGLPIDSITASTSLPKPWTMMMVAKLGATIVINTWMFGIGSSLSTTPLLGFSMANSNGRVQAQIRNQDNVTRALTPSPSTTDYRNAWRIYHMENDPTDTTNGMRFYVDGVLVDSGVPLDYGATPTIFDRMGIGGIYRTTIGVFAQTQLQYVAVYDHPLGQSRVTAHAQAFNKFPDYTPGSPIKPLRKSL